MAKSTRVGGVAVDQLKSIIGRVEKLEEERQASPPISAMYLRKQKAMVLM